ncbi:colicin M-like protein [Rhizobium sp. PP-F2F-G48]|uniref:lipid II-degrading bacteriocin n=1 Tax=Rhizobium sp. PP-F2F-G48 TaxID=2135651 RepID=UPI0010525D58|nr:lipid II-degrading bacteriocin [Rhizobium sp. PP-F2F-G48]TCM44839.1 colicin M-like protein [Rhizobium sp. PP-F2F-G48]
MDTRQAEAVNNSVLETIIVRGGTHYFYYWGMASNWMTEVESMFQEHWHLINMLNEYVDYMNSSEYMVDWFKDVSKLDAKTAKNTLIVYSNISGMGQYEAGMTPAYVQIHSDKLSNTYVNTATLHAGSFMPINALTHYLFGNGKDMKLNINDANIHISTKEISALQTAINSKVIGKQHIESTFSYSTYNDPGTSEVSYTVGNIRLTVKGDFTRTSANKWSFDGELTGLPDRYDGNMDTARSVYATLATAVLATLEVTKDGTPFNINITDHFHLHFDQNTLENNTMGLGVTPPKAQDFGNFELAQTDTFSIGHANGWDLV